jgi:hypothetical protein
MTVVYLDTPHEDYYGINQEYPSDTCATGRCAEIEVCIIKWNGNQYIIRRTICREATNGMKFARLIPIKPQTGSKLETFIGFRLCALLTTIWQTWGAVALLQKVQHLIPSTTVSISLSWLWHARHNYSLKVVVLGISLNYKYVVAKVVWS